MKILTQQQAMDFFIEKIGMLLDITAEGVYYLFSSDDEESLHWSPQKAAIADIAITSIGIEIARYGRKTSTVLPALMQILEIENYIEINSIDLLQTVTKGKEISMNVLEQFDTDMIALTYLNTPVAIGTVMGKQFYPLVDVGWFLREGD